MRDTYIVVLLIALGIFFIVAILCLSLPSLGLPIDIEKSRFWAQLFGGVAVIFTFAWAFFKDTQTLEQTRLQSATDLYVKSAELMANESMASRTAGVFALGSVATTSSTYHLAVRDTLAAFVRSQKESIASARSSAPLREDVQAALDVLGRRDVSKDPEALLDLRDCYLTRPRFLALTGFSRAVLFDCSLYGADFRRADLSYALMDHVRMGDWLAVMAFGDQEWCEELTHSRDWDRCMKYNFIANFEGAKLVGTRFVGAILAGAIFKEFRCSRSRLQSC